MAEATHSARGGMEISDQKDTFHGFLVASIWGCGHIAQLVALLTLAFAIGAGWWPGFFAYVAIGVGVGLIFKMGGAYWAAQVAQWVLLALGGILVPALAGLMQ